MLFVRVPVHKKMNFRTSDGGDGGDGGKFPANGERETLKSVKRSVDSSSPSGLKTVQISN